MRAYDRCNRMKEKEEEVLLFFGSGLALGSFPAAFLAAAASSAPSFGLQTTMVNIPSANFKTDAA